MITLDGNPCEQSEVTCAYAAQALAGSEIAEAEAHIASCPDCQHELESLRPVVNQFVCWPTDVLRPTTSLQANQESPSAISTPALTGAPSKARVREGICGGGRARPGPGARALPPTTPPRLPGRP